jgi:hypothetical protein
MAVCGGFVFVRSCTGMPYCKAVYRSEKIKYRISTWYGFAVL